MATICVVSNKSLMRHHWLGVQPFIRQLFTMWRHAPDHSTEESTPKTSQSTSQSIESSYLMLLACRRHAQVCDPEFQTLAAKHALKNRKLRSLFTAGQVNSFLQTAL